MIWEIKIFVHVIIIKIFMYTICKYFMKKLNIYRWCTWRLICLFSLSKYNFCRIFYCTEIFIYYTIEQSAISFVNLFSLLSHSKSMFSNIFNTFSKQHFPSKFRNFFQNYLFTLSLVCIECDIGIQPNTLIKFKYLVYLF